MRRWPCLLAPLSVACAIPPPHPISNARECAPALPASAGPATQPPFDAAAAWTELEEILRGAYAYLERDDFSVDAQLGHAKNLALAAPDAASFRRIAHRLTFAFSDPHLLVAPLPDDDPNVVPTSGDLVVLLRGNEYLIADVREGSPADTAGVRPGWAFVEADGRAVGAGVTEVWAGAVLAQTPRQRAYAATLLASGRRQGSRHLTCVVAGERRTFMLENPRAFAKRVEERPPLSTRLLGRAAVIRFENSLGRRETIRAFDEALEAQRTAEAIVIDLRNTPSGGNTDVARSIIGHFISAPQPYQVHEIPAAERSTTVPRRFVEYALPRAPHYAGPVAVVVGHWTGSMGEGLVIGLHAAAKRGRSSPTWAICWVGCIRSSSSARLSGWRWAPRRFFT